jgi:hypothetical protein
MLALLVQRVWRGYMDRVFVRVLRREIYAHQMKAARHQALMEVKARVIQSKWRARQSSKAFGLLKAAKEAKEARLKLEQASALQIQRILRGHFGRQTHRRVIREFKKRLHEWRSGICIQAAFRGMCGRRRAAYMRWLAVSVHFILIFFFFFLIQLPFVFCCFFCFFHPHLVFFFFSVFDVTCRRKPTKWPWRYAFKTCGAQTVLVTSPA